MTSDPRILRGQPVLPISKLSLPQYLLQCLKEGGNSDCLIDAENEGRRFSFADVLDKSSRLAEAFRTRNIGPGDVIVVCSKNCMEYPLISLSTLFVGAAFAPINFNYTPYELKHILSLLSPKVLFCSSETQENVGKVLAEVKDVTPLLVMMPDAKGIELSAKGFATLSQLIDSVASSSVKDFKPHKPADPSSTVGFIMCSSGTTGLPKAVQTTLTNLFVSLANQIHPQYYDDSDGTKVIPMYLPMFHVMGQQVIISALARKRAGVIVANFTPRTFLRVIQDYKMNLLVTVPPLMQLLATSDLVNEYDLSSIKRIVCGAAPLSKELQEAVSKRIGVKDIRQGYGLTEGTLAVLQAPIIKNKAGSSGVVAPGMEAKVINESGMLLGPNERGELCFRGPLIMKGYKNNESATNEMIDSEGWLYSGDVGYYDEEGYFFVVDRLKELIKYKGYQVPPAELEALLYSHPGVGDAAVIGVPDKNAGELPLAFVVRKDPKLTEKDVAEFVAKHLSPQKWLRGGVKFVETIPKSPSGKILRRKLREAIKSKM